MLTAGGVNELRGNPHLISCFLDAPLKHRRDIQLFPNFAHIDILALEGKRRGPGDDPQITELG